MTYKKTKAGKLRIYEKSVKLDCCALIIYLEGDERIEQIAATIDRAYEKGAHDAKVRINEAIQKAQQSFKV